MFAESQSFTSCTKPVAVPEARARGGDGTRMELEQFGELFGACASMRGLFRVLERLAATSASVMILGESGSGKELVANSIHQLSDRKGKPFVAVNCGAIPETLIESELFGHERGSFTGAARMHRGCFERADGGTLFLDEVTEMPIDMQVRLLRVLETGRFCRIGGDQEISTNVRVLAASNRELGKAVAEGRLREDLMYRLCVIPVTVPPLRDRGDDIRLLAQKFLQELNEEQGTDKYFADAAYPAIAHYGWPGNVRELKNVVHRAFVLSDDEVNVDIGVPAHDGASPAQVIALVSNAASRGSGSEVTIQVGMSLDEAERALIMATLKAVDGSKARASEVLGISLKTLYNRLHAYRRVGKETGAASAEETCDALAA